jgi:hypothetical protein
MMRELAMVAVCVGLCGCSSAPPQKEEEPEPVVLPEHAPEDFTLSVTVMGPATREGIDERARAERPARYIVEPDGALRAAIGPGATPRVYPGQTRRLTGEEMQRVWRLVVNTGLLEPGTLTRIESTETFFPRRERTTALIYVRERGDETHYAVRLPVGDVESPGVVQLIDEVAGLAWVPE